LPLLHHPVLGKTPGGFTLISGAVFVKQPISENEKITQTKMNLIEPLINAMGVHSS